MVTDFYLNFDTICDQLCLSVDPRRLSKQSLSRRQHPEGAKPYRRVFCGLPILEGQLFLRPASPFRSHINGFRPDESSLALLFEGMPRPPADPSDSERGRK